MKCRKIVGPDELYVEAWKLLRRNGVKWLVWLFDQIMNESKVLDIWRKNYLVSISKNKGNGPDYGSY